MEDYRGSLTFFTTYRPTLKSAIYSCPFEPESKNDETIMTDELSYNYNGQSIPPQALRNILEHLKYSDFRPEGVDNDRVSGLLFVSERKEGLETLHFSISDHNEGRTKVFQFSDVYHTYDGVRLEDSGCFADDYLVYVTTKDDVHVRRQPWTAVYMTNLKTGETTRLTPEGQADLSPAVSPCGTMIALSSFQEKFRGWDGEIEYLNTDIFVTKINEPHNRKLVVKGGGWPTWGSENVLFFHSFVDKNWGVFRADLSGGNILIHPVTPGGIDAITPAAIDDTKVAVVTIREQSNFDDVKLDVDQYRHVEIFTLGQQESERITQKTKPKANHYNPFVIGGSNGAKRIGYHRSNLESCPKSKSDINDKLESIKSPEPNVDLFRVSGAFPSFSPDVQKLAFVDNEFKTLYVIDDNGTHVVFKAKKSNKVFAPIWSQNSGKDNLYACMGPAFSTDPVEITAILGVSKDGGSKSKQLTNGFNNAFPCTNPDGTKLVFRSTRDGGEKRYKNLYIIENLESLENGYDETAIITRLTDGLWVDTHCEWSPNGNWIVFASNRERPSDDSDHGLDTGYFAVYLVKADDPNVVVRVVRSRCDDFAGHVNHPVFSPDGNSLAVVADLAAVSCDPISLPHFLHSVRPYGDIFIVDIDRDDIKKNEDLMHFRCLTHSKYENSTAVWTKFSYTKFPYWEQFFRAIDDLMLANSADEDVGETRHVTGHICIAGRKC